MYQKQPKKMLVMDILDILKEYSDEEHPLSQKDIIDILERDYNMKADRKSVSRNLANLKEMYPDNIDCNEKTRMTPDPKTGKLVESTITSDYYYIHDFTDAELRLLIDSILFSGHIPYKQCRDLVWKLEGLSNRYFRSHMSNIRKIPDRASESSQLFLTIEILDEAIKNECQVRFHYCEYNLKKQLVPRRNKDGSIKEYVINPYQMAATNGRYYLICNYDGYDDLSNYRIDRIRDIEILDTPVKPIRKLKDAKYGFDLEKHMSEHISMFSGESARCSFCAPKNIISDIIDYFGTEVRFSDVGESELTVTVPSFNKTDMRLWALQYATQVKVLSPADLAEQCRQDILKAAEKYNNDD